MKNATIIIGNHNHQNGPNKGVQSKDCNGKAIEGYNVAMPTITNNSITNSVYGINNCDGLIESNTISFNSVGIVYSDGEIIDNDINNNDTGIGHCNANISNNSICNNASVGINRCDIYGVIKNNLITNNGRSGVSYSDCIIRDNKIISNGFRKSGIGGGIHDCDGLIAKNVIDNNIGGNHSSYSNAGGLTDCDGDIIGNIISNNINDGDGGGLSNCDGSIINNTIVGNSSSKKGGAVYLSSANIKNNVIAFNSAIDTGGIYGICNNSFNDLWQNQNGNFGGGCSVGINDICVDPLFADIDNGDYHLKSEVGRWDPISETWVIDAITSYCIDAGDPVDSIDQEQNPNGNRINMGAYGGTLEASMSPNGDGIPPTPKCINPPSMDTNGDCKIDLIDFTEFASQWLSCGFDIKSACWE